jgi:two-component system phosphate regulon response regulator PhoB
VSPADDSTNAARGAVGRILLLLSAPEINRVLSLCLTAAGFMTRARHNAADGISDINRFAPDVVLLDPMPPKYEAVEIWRQLRASETSAQRSSVIALIRSAADIDPRLGLDLGPCDFVLYPFGVRDLVLRIDSIVRERRGGHGRASSDAPRRRYRIGPLELDVDGHYVLVNGVEVHVSALEMRLLTYLIENRGRVRSRRDLLQDVWGYNAGVATRTPDTHVNRLRTKLTAAGTLVETVRGAGYRLSDEFPVIVRG